MRVPLICYAACSVLCLATLASPLAAVAEPPADQPIAPKDGPIRLFNGRNLDGLYTFLKDAKYADPRRVFTAENGILHVSGDGLGAVITKRAYRDYHLVIEFRWGGRTWRNRKTKARDSGCLIHCGGPDNAYSGTWPHSFEAQIIEGGVGDIILVHGKDAQGKPLPISLDAEVTKDRDGETVWHPGGPRKTFHAGRINWFGRDPDWSDVLGYRGKQDLESPVGQWARMDVFADGSHIQIFVNGTLVNEGSNAVPNSGKILVQTELAEIWVRRWELFPLAKGPKPAPASR